MNLSLSTLSLRSGLMIIGLMSVCFIQSSSLEADETKKAVKKKASEPVSYHKDIRPLLQKHCQGCHQPAKAGGKLVLTSFSELSKGGRSQDDDPIVIPGKPEDSLLMITMLPDGDDPPEMPKDAKPLHKDELELFRRWIKEGAKDDSPKSSLRRFDQKNPPVYSKLPVITALDFSKDGKTLAVSGYNEVLLRSSDGKTLQGRLVGLSERIEHIVYSPDGKQLAVAGGTPSQQGEIQVWDVENKKLRVSRPVTFDTLYGASWSHDSKLVGFGCADNSLRAIDAKSGQQVLFQGAHNDWVLGTAFSKDSSHLISVSRDRSMKLVMVKTEQFIDNITSITPGALKGGLMSIQRHPTQDQVLTGGADGTPKIYRIYREKARKIGDDYNLIRAFEALPGRIFSTEFNSDGSKIIAGSSYERTGEVRVYSVKDGKKLWSLRFPTAIYSVAFHPNGKVAAAGGFDGIVRLIDVDQGKVTSEFAPITLAREI